MNTKAEIERLRKALMVCSHVIAQFDRIDPEICAAWSASGAWWDEEWQPEDVHLNLPEFDYETVKRV